MLELEDEPKDIQNATPVEDEVRKGEIDEFLTPKSSSKPKITRSPHRCLKAKSVTETIDCCDEKRRRHARQQTGIYYVHGPPCPVRKMDRTPRHCMTKDEYLDFLARPSKKCETGCEKTAVVRRLRPISPRIEQLARPMKRKLIRTLEECGSIMPAEMLDRLIEIVEAETALSPEQAENLVRDRRAAAAEKPRKRRHVRANKCEEPAARCSSGGLLMGSGDSCLDLEAARCQYAMALRFVRSILGRTGGCSRPASEYCDISEVVLDRLAKLLGYAPLGPEDRKSRQMRLLAELFACWIAGVLLEVADRHRDELEAECLRRRREAEELATLYQQEAWDDLLETDLSCPSLLDDNDDDDDDDDDEEEESRKEEEEEEKEEEMVIDESPPGESKDVPPELVDAWTQYELFSDDEREKKEEEEEDEVAEEEEEALDELEELVDTGLQTEPSSVGVDAATLAESRELCELEQMSSRLSDLLQTDLPFLSFAKILETLYAMLECESENRLCEPVVNRIHRAIYEKLEAVTKLETEAPKERLKDVMDVVSGKIARWLVRMLDEQQLRYLDEVKAQVKSREVRDWSKWIVGVADIAGDWAGWIDKVADEAGSMKRQPRTVTRQAWQDWTSKFEKNALLWRRTYLEALHHEHHNTMMLTDRQVVKTAPPHASEMAIADTNLEAEHTKA